MNQQGLPGLRRLFRQRTRWAQGNLQAMGHLGAMWRLDRPWYVRFDLVAYLLLPAIHAVVGVAFFASIVLAVTGVASFWGDSDWWVLIFFFLLGYGGVLMGCIARGAQRGVAGIAARHPPRAGLRGLHVAPLARARARGRAPAHAPERLGEDGARAAGQATGLICPRVDEKYRRGSGCGLRITACPIAAYRRHRSRSQLPKLGPSSAQHPSWRT